METTMQPSPGTLSDRDLIAEASKALDVLLDKINREQRPWEDEEAAADVVSDDLRRRLSNEA